MKLANYGTLKSGDDGRFGRPEHRSPKGSFWKLRYNTIVLDGAPTDIVETKYYGALDNFIGRVFPELICILDNGKVPKMDRKLSDNLKKAVFQMLLRSPDFIELKDHAIGEDFLDGLIEEYETAGEHLAELSEAKTERADPAKLRLYGRTIRTKGMFRMPMEALEVTLARTIRWVTAPQRCSYILSSRMVPRIGNGGPNGTLNPNSELWMPISPNHCLVLLNDKSSQIPLRVTDSRDHVRDTNEFLCRNSEAVGSHSLKLINSLTNQK